MLTRRDFLKFLGFTGAGVGLARWWGEKVRRRLLAREEFREGVPIGQERWITSVCRVCPGGCGIRVRVVDGRPVRIEGNPECPISQGALCPRGLAGLQTLWAADRVRVPLRRVGPRGGGRWEPVERSTAVDEVARHLRRAGGRVAALVQDDGGLAPRLWAAFLGTPAWAMFGDDGVAARAAREVLGWETGPVYDLAGARAILSLECPLLEGWGCATAVHRGYGQFRQDRTDIRGRLIQADAWRSVTAGKADLWVPLAPGTADWFALSVANVLVRSQWYDPGVERMPGFAAWRDRVQERYAPETTATATGVAPSVVLRVAQEIWEHRPTIVLAGAAALSATAGLETHRAALWLNLLLGSVGVAGGILRRQPVPASVGEPLVRLGAHALAARLEEPGAPEVVFLHEAGGLGLGPGWEVVRRTLRHASFVVALADRLVGAAAEADLVLPLPPPLEAWDAVVTQEEPRVVAIGLQQPAVPPQVGDLAATLREVAQAAGRSVGGLPRGMKEAAQAAFTPLARSGRGGSYGALLESPGLTLWEAAQMSGGWWEVVEAWRGIPAGRFGDPEVSREAAVARDPRRPLALVIGAALAAAGSAAPLPFLRELLGWETEVGMHPRTARDLALKPGERVGVESARGTLRGRMRVTEDIPEGLVVVSAGAGERVWGVVDLGRDEATGAPRARATPVRVTAGGV